MVLEILLIELIFLSFRLTGTESLAKVVQCFGCRVKVPYSGFAWSGLEREWKRRASCMFWWKLGFFVSGALQKVVVLRTVDTVAHRIASIL